MSFLLEPEVPFEKAIGEIPESDFVTIEGQRVYVRDLGRGPALVLLHGFASSSYSFRKLWEPLAESFRILAIDLNGFGFTQRPENVDAYRIEEQARLIAEVVRRKGEDEVTLIGHSYGCAVSMVLSAHFPELVSKLVLISPPSEFAKKPPWYVRNGIGIRAAFFLIHALLSNPKKFHELTLRAFHVKEALPLAACEVYRKGMLTEGLRRTCRGYARAFAQGGAASIRYDEIWKPTLVIAGEEDGVVPLESCTRVADSIKGSLFQAIPDCGHCAPEERPLEVIEALRQFV